ncbi:hypothetical protein KIPB_010596, partial [Kipferlia bialata]
GVLGDFQLTPDNETSYLSRNVQDQGLSHEGIEVEQARLMPGLVFPPTTLRGDQSDLLEPLELAAQPVVASVLDYLDGTLPDVVLDLCVIPAVIGRLHFSEEVAKGFPKDTPRPAKSINGGGLTEVDRFNVGDIPRAANTRPMQADVWTHFMGREQPARDLKGRLRQGKRLNQGIASMLNDDLPGPQARRGLFCHYLSVLGMCHSFERERERDGKDKGTSEYETASLSYLFERMADLDLLIADGVALSLDENDYGCVFARAAVEDMGAKTTQQKSRNRSRRRTSILEINNQRMGGIAMAPIEEAPSAPATGRSTGRSLNSSRRPSVFNLPSLSEIGAHNGVNSGMNSAGSMVGSVAGGLGGLGGFGDTPTADGKPQARGHRLHNRLNKDKRALVMQAEMSHLMLPNMSRAQDLMADYTDIVVPPLASARGQGPGEPGATPRGMPARSFLPAMNRGSTVFTPRDMQQHRMLDDMQMYDQVVEVSESDEASHSQSQSQSVAHEGGPDRDRPSIVPSLILNAPAGGAASKSKRRNSLISARFSMASFATGPETGPQ